MNIGYLVVALTSADADTALAMKQRLEAQIPGITAIVITGCVSAIYVPGQHDVKVLMPEIACELCGTNVDLTQIDDKRIVCMTCAEEYK